MSQQQQQDIDLFEEIDWSDVQGFSENNNDAEFNEFLKKAAKQIKEESSEQIQKPFLSTELHLVILLGLPIVTQDRMGKLVEFLVDKILAKLELKEAIKRFEFFFDYQKQSSNGLGLFEFDNNEICKNAVEKLHGLKIDKQHTLSAFELSKFNEIISTPLNLQEPKIKTIEELQSWIYNNVFDDQFLFAEKNKLYINWFDQLQELITPVLGEKDIVKIEFTGNLFCGPIKKEENKKDEPPKKEENKKDEPLKKEENKKDEDEVKQEAKLSKQQKDELAKKKEEQTKKEELIKKEEEIKKKKNEINQITQSINGNYIVVVNSNGFLLFGGQKFEPLNQYQHNNVTKIEFSPNENYILSFNNTITNAKDAEKSSENYIIWDTRTATKNRTFQAGQTDLWGAFKWSYDSQYIAKIGDGFISVYQLPNVSLLKDSDQKKSNIMIPNVQSFEWLKNQNVLCCCSFNKDFNLAQSNSKITLIEIPSRIEPKKWKSINWDLAKCSIYPSLKSDWIGILLTKRKKNKLSTFVQIANLTKKNDIEISDLDLEKNKVISHSFDTKFRKFAIVSEDPNKIEGSGQVFYNINIYDIEEKTFAIRECGSVTKTQAKEVLFSNNGTFFALVNADVTSASHGFLQFCFFKVSDKSTKFDTYFQTKMNYMDQASWDPTGRLLLTSSRNTKTFQIYTAYGKQIGKDTRATELKFIQWRNRPKVMLSDQVEKKITDDFKTIKKRFEEKDREITHKQAIEKERERNAKKSEFEQFLEAKRKQWDEIRKDRINLLGFDEDNLSNLTMDEIIEQEIVM